MVRRGLTLVIIALRNLVHFQLAFPQWEKVCLFLVSKLEIHFLNECLFSFGSPKV